MNEKFKKIDKEFLITDSSLNSYSFRLLTAGYQLPEYKKNPIGYRMHLRDDGVIVKWDDLRIDGDKVYGKPVINLSNAKGQQTLEEVQNGFLNAASVGHLVALEISSNPDDYLEGQKGPTVTKWYNRECSLVDIPGNYNSLTDLVDGNDNPINLADFKPQFKNNMKQIFLTPAQLALLPNLKADATQEEVNTAFNDLVAKANKADQLQNQVSTLTTEKGTLATEIADLKAAGSIKEVTDILDAALNKDKKITKEMQTQLAVQYKGKPVELKALVDLMPVIGSVVKNLNAGADKMKKFEGKTWDQLDQAGLLEDLKAADENKFFDLYEEEHKKKHNADKR